MAMSKKGFRFVPTDEILVQYLFEKIHHGFDDTHEVPLFEYDLYGSEEPSDVWEKFVGNRFEEGNSNEDLYFFTKLKKMSVTGSRINRAVGSGGTWSAAYSQEFSTRSTIIHGAPVITAKKTHLRYENEGSLNHGAWIMHEFCLGYMDDSNHFCRYDDPYVICRLRKSRKGRNQKKLGMKSLGDRDHQPNVITKKPRLLEQGCNEEGCFEYSRMGSTSSVQPQIDEVLEARNKSNSLSEFKSCVHGINGSSASLCEDVVGINIENDQVVVEEHSNPCTTTDESVLTTSTETPMSFDDVFQYDGREKCSDLNEDMSPIDADWILKYLLEDCDDGISTENNHVVVEEHSSLCTTTDEGVLTNPMSLDVDVFQFDNLCAWDDNQNYNAHSVQDHDDQPNVITKKAELCEPGCEEGVEYSRIGSKSTTVLPQIDQDFEARNLSNNSSEFTTSIQGIDVVIIQNDPDVVEAETPMSLDGNAFQYDNLCAREKCTNLDEGVSSTDADGMLKYLLEDDDGINIENDHVVVEEQSTSCTTVDHGVVLTNSTSAVTPMSFDIDEFQFDNLGASNDQIFPDEADEALKYF